jgi:glycosyltransferase involved in cell wall biosynthesis
MRRVLFLAHHYPPLGGAVGRIVGIARYLPELGYEPVVVTGPGAQPNRWSPRDERQLAKVADAEVHRVPGPEPGSRTGLRGRVERALDQPPPWIRWWTANVGPVARQVGEVDLILASLIPYETAFAAAELSRELGVPWVADLEDPWALDEMRVAPTAIHQRRDLARMRRGLATASAIVMNTAEAAARVRRELPELDPARVVGIPTGFDSADFSGPAPSREDGAFRIVHTGSMHTDLGHDHRKTQRMRRLLGGTSVDVDILTRSHVYLVQAIERLIAADETTRGPASGGHSATASPSVSASGTPGAAGRIELHLAGDLTDADRAVNARHGFVRAHGHLPHDETLALMRSADLLFLPMHELPPGRRAGLVPCKAYEYVASGRPILAAVPDGDARDLMSGLARASVCRPSDIDGMVEAIRARLHGTAAVNGAADREAEAVAALERRSIVADLAAVCDRVLGVQERSPAPA